MKMPLVNTSWFQAAKPASRGLFRYGSYFLLSLCGYLASPAAATIIDSDNTKASVPNETGVIKKPKIELGVLPAAQVLRDYRGSSETRTEGIVVPVFIYRGDIFRVDRNGVRGEVIQTPRFELNVSGDAALGGDDGDNPLREGMPELDPTIEFGPSANLDLSGKGFDEGLSLRLPWRAVFAFDSSGLEYIGHVFNPKLTFRIPNIGYDWRAAFNVGAIVGSDKYHDYYYRVPSEFATVDRPIYNPDNGFSGWYSKLSFGRRRGSLFYGFNLRYDYLAGAEFEDSPLVETDHYLSAAFGLIWFFWSSD